MVCPHAAIRSKYYDSSQLDSAPETFKSVDFRSPTIKGQKFTIQVAPEDCTGCTVCVQVCPAKNKANPKMKAINMAPQAPLRAAEAENYAFFLNLPKYDRTLIKPDVKQSQFCDPLFEYSGACTGCGETPYVKLVSQLFGDRAMIANATGCSSIYGGNLPTTPYAVDDNGRGPAWSNSLFEDNAEYGFGMRLSFDKMNEMARELVRKLAPQLGDNLVQELLNADQTSEAGIVAQRERVAALKDSLKTGNGSPEARRLLDLADYLVHKSVWVFGGDGWAFDIGYGGLDHVVAMNRNVNILVLDTGVYSNTGGQSSKATPLGAVAKFAAAGKEQGKKDLGLMAISYGSAYVAQIAFGAKDSHTVKVMQEAESYPGTSLIIAYSPCIAHGYPMHLGLEQQKLAVSTGAFMLYRFDPRRATRGESPLQLDSGAPKENIERFLENELRFRMLERSDPERYKELKAAAIADAEHRVQLYRKLAESGAYDIETQKNNGN
jgi:pyruvate-ferredoxin/flavodoxin oxidoreductase